jgi:hypothetical protein
MTPGIVTTGEERVDVATGVRAADGSKLEPEEQPARIVRGLEAPVKVGRGPFDPEARSVGTIGGALTEETDAISAAQHLATRCALCVNWRRRDWQRLRVAWSDPSNHAGAEILNRIRGELMTQEHAGAPGMDNGPETLDVEHAIAEAIAICGPLTEIEGEVTLTFYSGGCPTHDAHGRPLQPMFAPAGAEGRRASTRAYDSILRMAQGKEV